MPKIALAPDARKADKPKKPRADFPLFPHARGYWAKKVNGDTLYFGKIIDDPKGVRALKEWLKDKDSLQADEPSRPSRDNRITIEDLCDRLLMAKKTIVATGELTQRSYQEYVDTGERLIEEFGANKLVEKLTPADFDALRSKSAKTWGPVRLGNFIQRVRTIFKFGFEAGLLDTPVRLGPTFKKPSRKVMRKARAEKGSKMLEPPELRKIINAAGVPLKCFILLALNAGLGNSDIGNMPLSAIDKKRNWITYPRPKTGIERRFPLWPETVVALRAAIKARPTPKTAEARGLAFVTKYGDSWSKTTTDNPLSKAFRKLLDEKKLHRPGLGFYSLRHVFATIGGEAKDQPALSYIMGHADESMAAVYRERISDERLQAVVDHVHGWLFGEKKTGS